MKTHLNRLLLAAALAGGAIPVHAAGVDYRIDPEHTQVVVTWNHLGFSKPSAHAGDIQGVIRYDAANVSASSVKLDVPLASFTSHVPKLDEMLLGPEFFAAGKYPAIGFESTSVEDKGNGRLLIHGKLRIKDHEKAIVLEARQNKAGVHPTRSGRQSASTRPRSSSAAISASRRTRPTSATRSRCASRSKRWPTRRAEHSGDERLV